MGLLIVYLSVATLISFVCSLLESVILTVSPAYLAVESQKKRKSILMLADLKAHIDRPLAAILTLNTVAHTIGAAGVGAQVLKLYGNDYVAISSGILTVVILVFSEIIPKTIGAVHWKKLAPYCGYITHYLIYITYPFVLLSEFIHKLLGDDSGNGVTREEMIMTAEMGADEGTLRKKESLVIKNLLMLDKIFVYDIMTPRSVVFALNGETTVGEVFKNYKYIQFSRIPVYTKKLDAVEGSVLKYKLMEAHSQGLDNLAVKEFINPIHSVPEDITVSACFDQFIKRKEHAFIVVDDYGTTVGLVTLEDVMETLLGVEIVDEFDSVEDMRKYARDLWEERKNKKHLKDLTINTQNTKVKIAN